jgi:Mg2+-importing ATPase
MLSMAAASLVLPFLPLLPMQILLNNLLYDASEIAIPFDEVDAAETARPHDWDPRFIRRFMLVFGPLSSAFDLGTFWLLRSGFDADAGLFRSGWFVESLATQVLVIFVLRTRSAPWKSRAHPALAFGAIAVVAMAVVLPCTPLASTLGFVPLPPALLAAIAGMTCAYLACAEVAKRLFHRHRARQRARHPAHVPRMSALH